jgi:heme A synthase
MTGGVAVEHSHRLVAGGVGLLTLLLAGAIVRRRRDAGLRALALLAVALVVAQGVLGGVTVLYRLPTAVSTSHLAVAMLFLATLVVIVARTSRPVPAGRAGDAAMRPWLLGVAAVAWVQIVAGGLVRHTGSALACGFDIPWCRGAVWPAAGPSVLHMFHRALGVVLGLAVLALAARVGARAIERGDRAAVMLATLAAVTVAVQIVLGFLAVVTALSTPVAVAHTAVAALLFASLVGLYLQVGRGRAAARAADRLPALAGEAA